MSARVIHGATVTAPRAWGSTPVGTFDGLEAKVHWTDAAYPWHANDGAELFVVLAGTVDMHWRRPGGPESVARLGPGDVWTGEAGIEHRAVPQGEARVLVLEAPFADSLVDAA
jgi:mannose-6-phosphate isomerase-like protein (cupin superfamily)